MNWQTKKKVEEIIEKLSSGTEFRKILRDKFRGSVKQYDEWLTKVEEGLDKDTFKILYEFRVNYIPSNKMNSDHTKEISHIKSKKNEIIEKPNPMYQIVNSKKNMMKFAALLERSDEIFDFLDKEKKTEDDQDILYIHDEIRNIKDNKIKSMRISEALLKRFDLMAKEHSDYSKTNLLNLAVLNLLEKYNF